jgi:predicted DNA-binding ribbon-helix-helix protein
MTHREKTESQSFRVDERILDVLREEAKRDNVSLSALVNQILTKYVDYGRFASRMRALSLAQKTFASILNAASEEDVVKAAEVEGRSSPAAFITSMNGHLSIDNVVGFIKDLSDYANLFQYSVISQSPPTFTLVHELGAKWSLFIAHYLAEAFKSAGAQVKFTTSDRAVTFALSA